MSLFGDSLSDKTLNRGPCRFSSGDSMNFPLHLLFTTSLFFWSNSLFRTWSSNLKIFWAHVLGIFYKLCILSTFNWLVHWSQRHLRELSTNKGDNKCFKINQSDFPWLIWVYSCVNISTYTNLTKVNLMKTWELGELLSTLLTHFKWISRRARVFFLY